MKKKLILMLGGLSLISIIIIVVMVRRSGTTNKPTSTTSPTPSMTPIQKSPSPSPQTELPDDVQFNKAQQEILNQYPWYSKLPIDTKEYRIVYDFSINKFRIRLKVSIDTDQIDRVIQEALTSLQKIGVTPPIDYYTLDLSGKEL
jgi:hypothetical protein